MGGGVVAPRNQNEKYDAKGRVEGEDKASSVQRRRGRSRDSSRMSELEQAGVVQLASLKIQM